MIVSIVPPDLVQDQEKLFQFLRLERNSRLMESDWTQLPDSPLSAEEKDEWSAYRQALRDLTTTITFINTSGLVDFPDPPTGVD